MQMVIMDPVTPQAYSDKTLSHRPLGGTEATVIRIAEAMDAIVLQHNREDNDGRYRVVSSPVAADFLIVLRDPKAALEMAERFPNAKKWLWLHDLSGPATDRGKKLLSYAPQLAAKGIGIVCVSDFHASQVRSNFLSLPLPQWPRVVRIYNPVDVSGVSNVKTVTDPNKLVFFSSPHKGLDYALTIFAQLHKRDRNLQLYIANPGYLPGLSAQRSGVVNLGAIPHHQILRHVQDALCTFYPNYVYPETFGLALAESNALGVPVLTHDIGAAAEVLNGAGQFVDVPRMRPLADSLFWRMPWLQSAGEMTLAAMGCASGYRQRIRQWQSADGRPTVLGRPEFSIDNVIPEWTALSQSGSGGPCLLRSA